MPPIVIIGTGLAAYTLAREIRRLDESLPLLLITADDGQHYSKPLLSNAYKNGKTADTLAMSDAETMRDQLDAIIHTETSVLEIDAQAHSIKTADANIEYSSLVLAVGAETIKIPVGGDAVASVLSVNSLADYGIFRQHMNGKQRLVIMGAGLIGCEFANDVLNNDITVDVIDLAPLPLGRLVPSEAGELIRDRLAETGINWHLGTSVRSVDHKGNALRVTLENDAELDTDVVLSAVGLRSSLKLALQANLKTNRGIVVDENLQTSVTDIYALGDCAETGGLVLPFVMPIMHAARALAKTLTGDKTALSYPAMPVLVKTPACPIVVAPPAPGSEGQWINASVEDGLQCEFRNEAGALLGFTLVGAATSAKQALTKELPPTLTS